MSTSLAHGNRVAREVDNYLRTGKAAGAPIPLEAHLPPLTWDPAQHGETPRLQAASLAVTGRAHNFREVELPAAEDAVRTECRRCLRCDLEWGLQHRKMTPPDAAPAAAARA